MGGRSDSCTDTHVQDAAIRDRSKHVTTQSSPACAPSLLATSQAALPLTFHITPVLPLAGMGIAWSELNVYAWKSMFRHVSAGG